MKNVKLLILGMLVLTLGFNTSVLGQCVPKVSIGPIAYSVADDSQVFIAHEGDVLYYKVTVELSAGDCDIINGEPDLYLPDSTFIDVDDLLAMTAPDTELYNLVGQVAYYYTVDLADAVGGYVTAYAEINADSIYDPPSTTPSSASGTYPVRVINPSTSVGIGADEITIEPGDPVVLTITELNDGDDPLDSPYVELLANGSPHSASPLTKASPEYQGGDTNGDGILDPLEEWEWQVTDYPTVNTTYTVIGHGIDSAGYDVTWCDDSPENTVCDEEEKDEVSVEVECPEPCILITKSVDCDVSKVGDEVEYEICIENCGVYDLIDVEVTDPQLGVGPLAGFPSTLTPGQLVCVPFPYTIQPGDDTGEPGATLENQASVSAIDDCDDETEVTDESEIVSVLLVHPCLEVEKLCISDSPVLPGEYAEFEITLTNCGDVDLLVDVDDSLDSACEVTDLLIYAGDTASCTMSILVPEDTIDTEICNEVAAHWTIPEYEGDCLDNEDTVYDDDCCPIGGQEGCTPGYWKNSPGCWECFAPSALFDDVFSVDVELRTGGKKTNTTDDPTLMQALNANGGGINALARHAVAALLNACDADINYPMSVDQVIAAVQAEVPDGDIQGLKNEFAEYNELGCGQSSDNASNPCSPSDD